MTNQQRYQYSKAVWNIPWLILFLSILAGLLVIDEQPDEQTDIQFGRALPGHMEGAIEGGKAK